MEKELSGKESLAIITEMIGKAKREAAGDGSFQILLWGWTISLCNLGHYFLEKSGYEYPYAVWLLVIPAIIASIVYGVRKSQKARVKTHLDVVLNQLWLAIFGGIMVVLAFMPSLQFNQSPVILILAALGMFVTGTLIRVNMVKLGGLILAIAAIIAFTLPVTEQYLVSGIAIILGYLVPGYYLKRNYRERV
ncbi:hypothetical protein [Algoriphagus machipongonensis]|uniref:Uncharacterized protein n=1 Tax=Algoriphagus machipongonensis TaxID=388413 RepID=A3HUM6_9BACT|nr:hypothetical protein [Algoriphagus machipongonensis]EAZ81848.1 hypothetical protein ALPR1_01365 [Algoriphagus machipongonensis]